MSRLTPEQRKSYRVGLVSAIQSDWFPIVANCLDTIDAMEQELQELSRYKRAIDHHLCAADKTDWLGCNMDHGDYCDVCESDPEDHNHKRLAKLESELAASRAATLREAAANQRKKCQHIYPGHITPCGTCDRCWMAKEILSLIDPAEESALDRERAEAREQALIDVQQFYNQSDMPKCQIFEDWLKRQFAAPLGSENRNENDN